MRGRATQAVLIAATLTMTGCGAGDRPQRAGDPATAQIVRVAFPALQRLAEESSFAITVRNRGETTIADLVVTLSGLSERAGDGSQRPLWVVDEAPPGPLASAEDTRAAGPLRAGEQTTLRWRLTPAAAGVHDVTYEVSSGARAVARSATGRGVAPRGTRTARVVAAPARSRVDPATGRVVRVPSAASG